MAGWDHFLSTDEIDSVAALDSMKIRPWPDDAVVGALYKNLGVSGVLLAVPELARALTARRIDATYASPLVVVAREWNTAVKYMTSLPMSVGVGATVIRRGAFKKVSTHDQNVVAEVARATGRACASNSAQRRRGSPNGW